MIEKIICWGLLWVILLKNDFRKQGDYVQDQNFMGLALIRADIDGLDSIPDITSMIMKGGKKVNEGKYHIAVNRNGRFLGFASSYSAKGVKDKARTLCAGSNPYGYVFKSTAKKKMEV